MTVLVVGATGNAGSSVVRELRSHGVATRAFVRDPGRARALLGEDVELAAGDLGDPASLTRALDGVERLFLACGNVPGQVELESNAIEAARAAGVRLVVKLSAAAASPDSPLLFPRWQGEIEQRLRASGLPWVLLRPTSYMTNLFLSAQAVRATGKLLAPAGAARISMIDPRDVGAVGAAVLAGEGHDGAAYLLSGPAAITYADVAAALSEATGRTIEFVDVPDEAARGAMLADGVPEQVADFVVMLFGALRDGIASEVTDTVQRLTGREPRGIAEWARDHAGAFAAAEQPAPA
ncbi:MAG TPA: SDR family oxidoreductase [Gaiellaceae bacterium]|nr:SDR family oxidoreductase [Gaiellaceae bacterium]